MDAVSSALLREIVDGDTRIAMAAGLEGSTYIDAVQRVVRTPAYITRLRVAQATTIVSVLVRQRQFTTLDSIRQVDCRRHTQALLQTVPMPVDVSGDDVDAILTALSVSLANTPQWEEEITTWLVEDLGPARVAHLLNRLVRDGIRLPNGRQLGRQLHAPLARFVQRDAVDVYALDPEALCYYLAVHLRTGRGAGHIVLSEPTCVADALVGPTVSDELCYTVEAAIWSALHGVEPTSRQFAHAVVECIRQTMGSATALAWLDARIGARRGTRIGCLLAAANIATDDDLVELGRRVDGGWASWVLAALAPERRHLLLRDMPHTVELVGAEDILSSAARMGRDTTVDVARRARPGDLGGWLAAESTRCSVDEATRMDVVNDLLTTRPPADIWRLLEVVDREADGSVTAAYRPDLEQLAIEAPRGGELLALSGALGGYVRHHVVRSLRDNARRWELFDQLHAGWTGSIAALCRTCTKLAVARP